MNARTVRNRNEKLAAYSLYEIKKVNPLLLGKNVLEALGNLSAVFVVKIIVCLVRPGA